jgi:hypothetical protein
VTFSEWWAENPSDSAMLPHCIARAAWNAATDQAAAVCEQVHAELDAKFAPEGCTDTALVAAGRVREGRTP